MPVPHYTCDEDTDCNEPSVCESVTGVQCYGGECHYEPLAAGSTCDDADKCTSNDQCDSAGVCRGEAMACDSPPADFCSEDDSVFYAYSRTGVCNSAQGACEYTLDDSACDDCRHQCLHLPHAPGNLVAGAGDARVTVTWNKVVDAQSYNVYVSQTAGEAASAVPFSTVSPPYTQSGLTNGTTYHFAVSAVAEAGEGDLTEEKSATPSISTPAQLDAASGDEQVTLTWASVPGADGYNLYWALDPSVTLDSSRASDVTSPYVHEHLANSTTYYYALTAVDGPSESELSGIVSVTTTIDTATRLVAVDAKQGDHFGASVTLCGNDAIVGAGSAGADNGGAAYVLHHNGSGWDPGATLAAPEPQPDASFGNSAGLDGDFAIVGAHLEDGVDGDLPIDAGAAYVFHFDGSSWDAGTRLAASDAEAGDRFGESVALSGEYAIVGAIDADGVGAQSADAGAAYVFHFDKSGWDQGTRLGVLDLGEGDGFGVNVALSGEYAIVGASRDDGAGDLLEDAGAAYVFHRTVATTWDSGVKIAAPEPQAGARFGNAVAISGEYAIVGAPLENIGDGPDAAGAAYVFLRTGENSWGPGTKLVAPDAGADDRFGVAVAISGEYAVVGAWREDGGDGDPSNDAGAAYVFRRVGENTWDKGTKLQAPDADAEDRFGISVALSGGRVLVGAFLEDGGDGDPLSDAGAAYVYDL